MNNKKYSNYFGILIIIFLSIWLGSGFLYEDTKNNDNTVKVEQQENKHTTVQTQIFHTENYTNSFKLSGETVPSETIEINAKIDGEINNIFYKKGDFVNKNQKIMEIFKSDLKSRLEASEKMLNIAQKNKEDAEKLFKTGVYSENRFLNEEKNFLNAQKEYDRIIKEKNNTLIKTPISGFINEIHVKNNENILVGQKIIEISKISPLKIRSYVNQSNILDLSIGQKAEIFTINNKKYNGTLSFISKIGDKETKTFPIEITIENKNNTLPSGLSVDIEIKTSTEKVHFIPTSIIALDKNGNIGVKSIKENNKVSFLPIEILSSNLDGIVAKGLPDTVELIVRGQGFVSDDEIVKVKRESNETNN